MDQKSINILVENYKISQEQHGPSPLKRGEIFLPCSFCPQLSPRQEELFQEMKLFLKKIAKKNAASPSYLETLKSKFSKDNPDRSYFDILNVHNSSTKWGCETLLHLAADVSDYESMIILLQAGANPNVINRWNQLPMHMVVDEGDGCHCPSCNKKNAECVKLLLEYGSETDVQDWEGETPLACSALTLMDDCARILWHHGASLHAQGSRGTVGMLVARYIPEEVCSWMDNAIQQHDKERLQLQLDFGVIIGSVEGDAAKYSKETHFLVYMTSAHRKAKEMLLLHPLVQAYLHLKWDVVSILFTVLQIAYLGIALLYTCFIISFFLYNCPYEESVIEEDPAKAELSRSSRAQRRPVVGPWEVETEACSPTTWIYTMSGFMVCFVVCMLLNELYEVAQGFKKYIKNGLNYGWLLMIVTVTLNVLPVYVGILGHWQYVVAAFGVFLVWGMFLSQLARDPKIGIYLEMLGSIVTEFTIFSATYFALIIGFAFGFAVLFPNNPMFEYVYGFLPFVKSLLIMIGETDYETLFDEEENSRSSDLEYSIGAHIMFVGFIIVVTILLSNLLLGLAISDVQQLRSKATLSRTIRLIQQIDLLETLFHKTWIPMSLRRFYKAHFSIQCQCASNNDHIPDEEDDDDDDGDVTERNMQEENYSEGCDGKTTPDSKAYKPLAIFKRLKGPIFKGLQPFRFDSGKNSDRLPKDLKEQFIPYVDKDECSKKDGESVKSQEFCKNCEFLLQKLVMSSTKE